MLSRLNGASDDVLRKVLGSLLERMLRAWIMASRHTVLNKQDDWGMGVLHTVSALGMDWAVSALSRVGALMDLLDFEVRACSLEPTLYTPLALSRARQTRSYHLRSSSAPPLPCPLMALSREHVSRWEETTKQEPRLRATCSRRPVVLTAVSR